MNRTRSVSAVLALLLVAFAVFEGVKYGAVAAGVLVVFALLPDVALIGAFAGQGRLKPSRVAFYNAMHTPWLPIVLMLVSLAPIPALGWGLRSGLEMFLAGLAWLAHIALDRAIGYGKRDGEGRVRAVGRPGLASAPCAA